METYTKIYLKNIGHTIIKLLLLLGTGYLLSNIITKEVVIVISLLVAISIVRWVFSFTLSIVFTIVKWVCILGGIALLLSII